MKDNSDSAGSVYDKLTAFINNTFPKACQRCGLIFKSSEELLEATGNGGSGETLKAFGHERNPIWISTAIACVERF